MIARTERTTADGVPVRLYWPDSPILLLLHGDDTEHLAVAGDLAGGNLGTTPSNELPGRFRAQALLDPVTDQPQAAPERPPGVAGLPLAPVPRSNSSRSGPGPSRLRASVSDPVRAGCQPSPLFPKRQLPAHNTELGGESPDHPAAPATPHHPDPRHTTTTPPLTSRDSRRRSTEPPRPRTATASDRTLPSAVTPSCVRGRNEDLQGPFRGTPLPPAAIAFRRSTRSRAQRRTPGSGTTEVGARSDS